MSDVFDPTKMQEALGDVTNNPSVPRADGEDPNLAAEKGWAPPSAYKYDEYNAAGKQAEEIVAASEEGWASNSARYEWNDEFGDVGPAVPELEKQLYRHEFTNRKGIKYDK